MFPVSAAFLEAVRGSHKVVSRARIVTNGFIGTSPSESRDLKIVSGAVTLDATADVRGTADLEVAEKWPNANTIEDIVPYGTEVQITRGIVFGSGSVQRVPLGIYMITNTEQSDVSGGPVRITLSDRMYRIVEGKLEIPRVFPVTATVGDVMLALVQQIYPNQVPEWDDETTVTGKNKTIDRAGIVVEEDRFDYLNNMVQALGKIWYFDYRGQLVVRTPPASFTPVYTVDAGEKGVLVGATRSLNREGIFNIVRALGEGLGGVPVYGIAEDDDPASVTYVGGQFGRVPKFISSPYITNAAQAVAAARAELNLRKGFPYSVDFSMVPNPALEPLDGVTLVYPIDLETQPHQRFEEHVLEQLVIGLGTDTAMMCNTKLSTNRGALS